MKNEKPTFYLLHISINVKQERLRTIWHFEHVYLTCGKFFESALWWLLKNFQILHFITLLFLVHNIKILQLDIIIRNKYTINSGISIIWVNLETFMRLKPIGISRKVMDSELIAFISGGDEIVHFVVVNET